MRKVWPGGNPQTKTATATALNYFQQQQAQQYQAFQMYGGLGGGQPQIIQKPSQRPPIKFLPELGKNIVKVGGVAVLIVSGISIVVGVIASLVQLFRTGHPIWGGAAIFVVIVLAISCVKTADSWSEGR